MKKLVAEVLPFQSLQESWEHFAADVLSGAGPAEQKAMRNAFFCGASTAYLLFIQSLEAPSKSKSSALAQALFEELDEFLKDEMFGEAVRRGRCRK